jgi:hypothetical protein
MAAITGVVTYNTVATVTAASGGDATTIAGMFNGVLIPGVSTVTKPVAAAVSSVVTITWPQTTIRAANGIVRNIVSNIIAGNLALTSPINVTVSEPLVIT